MNMRHWKLVLPIFLCLAVLTPSSSHSQQFTADEYWREQLSVYDGIALRCEFSGVEEMQEVCKAIGIEFLFLAATAKIKAVDCASCDWTEYYSRIGDAEIVAPLRLEVLAASTKDEFHIGGVVHFSASGDFASFSCLKLDRCDGTTTNPTIVHWTSYATFSGTPNAELVQDLVNAGEVYLKTFLTLFLRARE